MWAPVATPRNSGAKSQNGRGPQRGRAGSPAEQRGPHAGSPRGVQDLGWGAIRAGLGCLALQIIDQFSTLSN
jgi:hypothetical protein